MSFDIRKVKLSICLLGISACVAQTITITNKCLLLLLCGLHSQQISSKQTLSLTFLITQLNLSIVCVRNSMRNVFGLLLFLII